MVSLRNYDDKVTDNTDNWVKMELSIVINAQYQQLNKQHPSTFLHCGGADPLYKSNIGTIVSTQPDYTVSQTVYI